MPRINIVFRELGITAIQRSEKGVVAMILKDTKALGAHILTSVTGIPADLAEVNKAQIKLAFIGYVTPPRQVLLFVMDSKKTLEDALKHYATQQFDYLIPPLDVTPEDAQTIALWVKSERLVDHTVKTVLPNLDGDHEGIVNFTATSIRAGTQTCTTAEYCARIAGLIAGTPMKISCTYARLPEVADVDRKTKEELDDAIDRGEFVLFHDGKKVKVGRAVNSLTTTTQDKGDSFKKIKIIEAMDMIRNDIRMTAQDNYIGKYANSYDNKCLLVMAIKGYFEALERSAILERGTSEVDIDVDAQENYLKSKGIDTSEMTLQELRRATTGSKVFLKARVHILDAIEDIDLDIAM